jgi:2,3-bisphosphoglycerate-dependent phosphoglycerate mutase
MMMLDHLSPSEVTALELATGVPIAYELDTSGEVISKKILND